VTVNFSAVSYTFSGGILRVTLVNVASGQMFTLRVHLDYKLKGTAGYPANSPTTFLRTYTFDTTVNGASIDAPTVRAAGKKATAIGGFVADTNGDPKSGLQARVYKGTTLKWSTVVDGDGYYYVDVAKGGPYSIILYNSFGVPVWIKTGINVAADTYVPLDFRVLPIDCAIQGFVKDDLGNPVAGVTVQVTGPWGNVQNTTTITNAGGYYLFRFYLPGTYTVKITVPPGYTAMQDTITVTVHLTDTDPATVDFVLTKI
jgi:hypothetical protein